MSTRVDIIRAKADFEDHKAAHMCRPALMLTAADIAAGQAPCAERVRLARAYYDTAGRWGAEPGDAAKVTEQYAWQTALLGQRVQMAA